MMPPVCLQCHVPMKCVKTGARAFECNVRQDANKQVNLDEIEALWACDLYACPACGVRSMSNFGDTPLFRDFQKEEIKKWLADPGISRAHIVWFINP